MAPNTKPRPRPTRPVSGLCVVLILLASVGGCASYEYDVVQPQELARHVGTKEWTSAARDPLEYRFLTVESRLVVEVHNRSSDRVQLLGDRSAVVDPKGQSHPLASQPIEPNSFAKLILPPMPATAVRSGPSIGFGVGVGVGSGYGRGYYPYGYAGSGFGESWYDEPRYYAVYDPNDPTYWEWSGEGEARLTLTFERAGKQFAHEWTFARKKSQ